MASQTPRWAFWSPGALGHALGACCPGRFHKSNTVVFCLFKSVYICISSLSCKNSSFTALRKLSSRHQLTIRNCSVLWFTLTHSEAQLQEMEVFQPCTVHVLLLLGGACGGAILFNNSFSEGYRKYDATPYVHDTAL